MVETKIDFNNLIHKVVSKDLLYSLIFILGTSPLTSRAIRALDIKFDIKGISVETYNDDLDRLTDSVLNVSRGKYTFRSIIYNVFQVLLIITNLIHIKCIKEDNSSEFYYLLWILTHGLTVFETAQNNIMTSVLQVATYIHFLFELIFGFSYLNNIFVGYESTIVKIIQFLLKE